MIKGYIPELSQINHVLINKFRRKNSEICIDNLLFLDYPAKFYYFRFGHSYDNRN
ncbi:hypothetical protein Barb4_00216 [Bacteroidales bacterium Barb4]|nr:hypothetical protein Barb4_00216 [Bacteroidales bacterium Barb4]